MSKAKKKTAANIIWFEIPADRPERAQKFYIKLFGWRINAFPGMTDYWHIDTGGGDDTPDGGLMARKHPGQPITNYVNVPSVTRGMAKASSSAGKSACPRRPCRRWAILPSARTPRKTRSPSGKSTERQNKSPQAAEVLDIGRASCGERG